MGAIILFDGECNFCDASVQFIMKRDQAAYFQFASLQSDIGQQLLAKHAIPNYVDSLVLIDNGHAFIRSTAALRIASKLDGAWKLFMIARIVPSFLRDPLYNLIARNRYKWFGKKETCMLPTPEQRKRFLS